MGESGRQGSVRLGVLGWPVAHSRSPAMQNAALRAVGLAGWRYSLLPVPPELLDETVRALPAAGFRGVNVTIPHKEAAFALADRTGPGAGAIRAANTLLFEPDGTIVGQNTDAPALIAALPRPARGSTALVLGAGGSARAAVWALLDAGAREVRIWNRTRERAARLAEELGAVAVRDPEPADLLVQCTPQGMDPAEKSLKHLPFRVDEVERFQCVIDFVYRSTETPLVRAARERGIPAVDGRTLLVGQGALSFELFTGRSAPLSVMRSAVAGDE